MREAVASTAPALRVLLIDEDPARRARGSARLKARAPALTVLEAETGLDYARHLAAGPVDAAAAPRELSWARGADVLARVRARNPRSITVLLDDSAPSDAACEFWDHVCAQLLATGEGESPERPNGARAPSPEERLERLGAQLERIRRQCGSLASSAASSSSSGCASLWYEAATLLIALEHWLGLDTATPAERAPVEVGDAVRAAMRALAPRLTGAGARVLTGALPTLLADERDLRLLFYHLIDNALRFRSEASPRIAVRARALDRGWELSVEDNGLGVGDAEAGALFEMFRRGAAHRHAGGAGLGLGVCRHIAHKYGGSIAFESRRHAGAKVVAQLAVSVPGAERVTLEVLVNGETIGRISVSPRADKADITYAALSLPRMGERLGDLTIKDVRVTPAQAVDIIA